MSEKHKLNKSQNEAVEYIRGPLLIVAGAGTGKTSVITSKIAYLIENGLAKPEEILALTFTDKAAEEMQARVDGMIDIGYSEIQISTFHAFCQKILERHGLDIGLGNQFKLLTQTSAWLLIRKNFHLFNLDYYRPISNPFRHIHELLKHFSKCKDELISPEEYLNQAESVSKNSGDMVVEEKNRLTEIANAYHTYNQILRDNSAFDFGDLIYFTHELFKKRPKILERYQKQFKFILVDEFQDVNWAQYALLQMLNGNNNQLTVVGDDDQSIYAFRGASVSNILHFKSDFPNSKEIVLNENYRSEQQILDLSYESIQHNNPDRLEVKLNIDKKLISKAGSETDKKKSKKKQDSVVHVHANSLNDEIDSVLREIARLKKTDKSASWDDFAILVRANNHAEPFINALDKQGFPYEFLSSSGLFRQPIVLDCLSFLRVLDNYRDDASFFRLLYLPFLNCRERDIHNLTFFAKKKAVPYFDAMKRAGEYELSEEGKIATEKIISIFHDNIKKIRVEKPSSILYNFLEKIGYLNYLTKGEENGDRDTIRQIYHLKQFFEFLTEYETVTPDHRLNSFLDHFDLISDSGDKGSLYQPSDTPDSINIMTIHAAKGLEFKYVFVVNMVEDRFPSRRRGESIEIPSELIKEKLPEGDSHIEEERRLFYVALTRAKTRLYLTSANNYGGERTKKISRFLDELGFKVGKKEEAVPIKLIEPKAEIQKEKGEFVFDLPKIFSFSQLRAYETCPFKYKLAHILKLPTKSSASLSFGSTIHNTLQIFYCRVQEMNRAEQISLFGISNSSTATLTQTKVKVPSLEELVSIYESKWIDDWYNSEFQKEQYYKKGKEILKIFYNSQEGNWTIPEKLEESFRIKIGDYFLSGRIDRVDKQQDGTLEIIDYKTGKSKEKLTGEDKEQLLIYQIAVEQLPEFRNLGKTGKLTFYYLEDDLRTSFVGEGKDIEKLKQKLLDLIGRIYNKDFTATPSQFACDYCDFKQICDYKI